MARPDQFAMIDTPSERSVSFAPPDQTAADRHSVSAEPVRVARRRSGPNGDRYAGTRRRGFARRCERLSDPAWQSPASARSTTRRWRVTACSIGWTSRSIAASCLSSQTRDMARRPSWPTSRVARDSGRCGIDMDERDRDWMSFMSHLVASGREHDPTFAPRTSAMLEAGAGTTTRDEVVQTFLQELPLIAPDSAILIFDDFHAGR